MKILKRNKQRKSKLPKMLLTCNVTGF